MVSWTGNYRLVSTPATVHSFPATRSSWLSKNFAPFHRIQQAAFHLWRLTLYLVVRGAILTWLLLQYLQRPVQSPKTRKTCLSTRCSRSSRWQIRPRFNGVMELVSRARVLALILGSILIISVPPQTVLPPNGNDDGAISRFPASVVNSGLRSISVAGAWIAQKRAET
jgi:hypothetical protein